MNLKYVCQLIVVDDLAESRHFYEELLGQTVKFDFGENITFEGDFAIHQKAHFLSLLGEAAKYPIKTRAHSGELYFETGEIESIQFNLKRAGVEFIHEIREQPWGQGVMRLYDPNGHIIEIGEFMETVVLRFHQQGLSETEISEKSSMPREFVERVIQEFNGIGKTSSD